jgi:hypothetical protein
MIKTSFGYSALFRLDAISTKEELDRIVIKKGVDAS